MIRVLLADDHALVREGCKEILSHTPDIVVVAETATANDALLKAESTHPNVVVMDISMPGSDTFEILGQFKRHFPRLAVLVLSMHSEQLYGVRALRAGAAGYLMKDSGPEQLIAAIRKVATGGKYLSETLADTLANALTSPKDNVLDRLSDREYAVLLLIGSGRAVTEIAEELRLSVKTISTYRARVLEKLNLRNNAELVRYVLEHQLPGETSGSSPGPSSSC